MRLDPNLTRLEALVGRMGARQVVWRVVEDLSEEALLLGDLTADGRILSSWAELELTDAGLLSFDGYQVVLHIRDVQKDRQTLEVDRNERPKYHVCECRTLERMRVQDRFDRYVMSSRTDGSFLIEGIDRWSRSHELELELDVCMNCLEKLDFEGFKKQGANWQNKRQIRDFFNLEVFFESSRTHFRQLPRYSDENAPPSGYTEDWTEVSRDYRVLRRWCCEKCGVDLSDRANRGLLHVHHIKGIKSDNDRANLKALCLYCHQRQPAHDRMSAWFSRDWKRIREIRQSQGIE